MVVATPLMSYFTLLGIGSQWNLGQAEHKESGDVNSLLVSGALFLDVRLNSGLLTMRLRG